MNNIIFRLASEFRSAIDNAKKHSEFVNDILFRNFPSGCCGIASELLAYYLLKHGYETVYVCGTQGDQSHAWLVLKDENVSEPEQKFYVIEDEIRDIFNQYSGDDNNAPIDITAYEKKNVEGGLIIDITADQFSEMKNVPVYVGYMDNFHKKFDFYSADTCNTLKTDASEKLYRKICNYLKDL